MARREERRCRHADTEPELSVGTVGLSGRALSMVRSLQAQLRSIQEQTKQAKAVAAKAIAKKEQKEALVRVARKRQCHSQVEELQAQKLEDMELQRTLVVELEAAETEVKQQRAFQQVASKRADFEALQQQVQQTLRAVEDATAEGHRLKAELEVSAAELAATRQMGRDNEVAAPPGKPSTCEQEDEPWTAQDWNPCTKTSFDMMQQAETTRHSIGFKNAGTQIATEAMKVQRVKDLRRQSERISELNRRREVLKADYEHSCKEGVAIESQLDAVRAHNRQIEMQTARVRDSMAAECTKLRAELRRRVQQIRVLQDLCCTDSPKNAQDVEEHAAFLESGPASLANDQHISSAPSPLPPPPAEPFWSAPTPCRPENPCDVSAEVCLSSIASPEEVSFGQHSQPSTWRNAGPGAHQAPVEELIQQPAPLNLGELFTATLSPTALVTQDASCAGTPSPGSATFSWGHASPPAAEQRQGNVASPSALSVQSAETAASSGMALCSAVVPRDEEGRGSSDAQAGPQVLEDTAPCSVDSVALQGD